MLHTCIMLNHHQSRIQLIEKEKFNFYIGQVWYTFYCCKFSWSKLEINLSLSKNSFRYKHTEWVQMLMKIHCTTLVIYINPGWSELICLYPREQVLKWHSTLYLMSLLFCTLQVQLTSKMHVVLVDSTSYTVQDTWVILSYQFQYSTLFSLK